MDVGADGARGKPLWMASEEADESLSSPMPPAKAPTKPSEYRAETFSAERLWKAPTKERHTNGRSPSGWTPS